MNTTNCGPKLMHGIEHTRFLGRAQCPRIAISSGHSTKCRGAADILDEVNEATKVVDTVTSILRDAGVTVASFHDTISDDQSENLNRIVDWHNDQTRDLDVSVHFNAYEHTSKPMGCEVLYITQEDLASRMSEAIADAGGFIDRGPKYRSDLFVLNNTDEPAILIETCFVDSQADADLYRENYQWVCQAIASVLADKEFTPMPPEPPEDDLPVTFAGKCSWFGGPDDTGVSPSEGLAFIYDYDDAPHLFLPTQPPGTTGLARRLDPEVFYVACRWDYDVTPKSMLADQDTMATVSANGKTLLAWPADWGPHEDTGRVADVSPGLMEALGITTDDAVEVVYPAPDQPASVPPEREVVLINISAPEGVEIIVNGVVVNSSS
jgi:N-acetylmuramoyl-L-alanine amidase